MKKIFLILFILSLISCAIQRKTVKSISCDSKVNIQVDKKNASNANLGFYNQKAVTIFFLNDFNNRIQGYINGVLKFDQMVITNGVTGTSDKNFVYKFEQSDQQATLKIVMDDSSCFDILIKNKYKYIYVFNDSSKNWTIRYSNRYYIEN